MSIRECKIIYRQVTTGYQLRTIQTQLHMHKSLEKVTISAALALEAASLSVVLGFNHEIGDLGGLDDPERRNNL